VDLLGGSGRILVDEEAAQLAKALQSRCKLGGDNVVAAECVEVPARVGLRIAAAEFGELETEHGEFGDVVVELIDPTLDDNGIAQRLMAYDPRYFTTYYAIDAINFTPVDVSSALDTLEGPYLPLVVQEAAGLPLDPSFAEQKKILIRCKGLFYGCANGAEARHFNRMLIDAGLIKNL